jgi:hypothetical protein
VEADEIEQSLEEQHVRCEALLEQARSSGASIEQLSKALQELTVAELRLQVHRVEKRVAQLESVAIAEVDLFREVKALRDAVAQLRGGAR